jgi:Tfp pilus assembly protein PilV
MNALKPYTTPIALLVISLGLLVWAASKADSAMNQASERERQAVAAAQEASEAIEAYQDSLRAALEADSVREAAYEDSVAVWASERARLRAEVSEDEDAHASLADSIRAVTTDSVVIELTGKMEERFDSAMVSRDSIEATKDAQIIEQGRRILSLETIVFDQNGIIEMMEERDRLRLVTEDALRDQVAAQRRQKNLVTATATIAVLGLLTLR